MGKTRNSNIEVLRFLLMVAILLWHVIVHGCDFKHIGCDGFVYDNSIPVKLFLASLTLPALYCFVLISGFYELHLKAKRLIELLLWCVIVSVVSALIKRYFFGYEVGFKGLKDFWQSFFPITSNGWWFMTAYVQLMVLSPFLNYGMKQMDRHHIKILLIVLYCMSLLHMVILEPNAGSSLLGLIFIYLLGRYFNVYGFPYIKKIRRIYLVSLFSFFGLMLAGYYLICMSGVFEVSKVIFYFMGLANPFIVIMSVCIFYFFINLPVWSNTKVNALIAPNLFIYLITERWGGAYLQKYSERI